MNESELQVRPDEIIPSAEIAEANSPSPLESETGDESTVNYEQEFREADLALFIEELVDVANSSQPDAQQHCFDSLRQFTHETNLLREDEYERDQIFDQMIAFLHPKLRNERYPLLAIESLDIPDEDKQAWIRSLDVYFIGQIIEGFTSAEEAHAHAKKQYFRMIHEAGVRLEDDYDESQLIRDESGDIVGLATELTEELPSQSPYGWEQNEAALPVAGTNSDAHTAKPSYGGIYGGSHFNQKGQYGQSPATGYTKGVEAARKIMAQAKKPSSALKTHTGNKKPEAIGTR